MIIPDYQGVVTTIIIKLEARRSKAGKILLPGFNDGGTNSPLEPPEETQPCGHLDFSPLRSILNF